MSRASNQPLPTHGIQHSACLRESCHNWVESEVDDVANNLDSANDVRRSRGQTLLLALGSWALPHCDFHNPSVFRHITGVRHRFIAN